MTTHKCPACDYRRPSFASVAMHFIRCHHVTRDGYGNRLNPKLAAKLSALKRRFDLYRQQHP